VIYYPKAYDPFSALPLPKEQTFDPPSDHAFPILFRRSLGRAVGEALTFEHDLRAALKGDDDTHLVFLLLDGELRLASGSPETSGSPDLARIEKLGLGDLVSAMIVDRRPRTEVLARALRNAEPLPRDAERHAELVALGGDQLRRWRGLERSLLREAVRTETKSVQDLRYALEFELSQTLASKKDAQKQVLQQGSLPGSPES
jgi:hypothetical protein